ncbi:MAG: hypothetical protein KAW90_05315 [Dehalococcoidales bacterium]|nr:hypothetical protein [Dehalococcoidales bacterium]
MRELTSTLLAAQKQEAAVPYVKIEAVNKVAGVVRQDWDRLYDGSEDDYFHALTMPGDGSLIRARITLPADSRKLYRQRVGSPGPGSDFSQWTYTGQYNAVVVAAASLGAEVSIFWIKSNREIRRIKSTDYGASWGSPELIDYTPTTAIYGLAAAYKPGGDLAIFFADQSTLYVKKNISGQWQTKAAWNKTAGDLSGVACVYDSDWNLLVTGKDTAGNYKLWSLVYGDGGDVAVGTWSALKELASAPSGGDFEYRQPFLDKPDVYRCFFIEKFSGTEAYNRPFRSHSVPDTDFLDGLWREPAPFNLTSEYGVAMAHHGDYGWLSGPDGVWRAPLAAQSLDLTADVISARQELGETTGGLTVELRNDDGRYAAPGEGDLAILDIGCQLEFSPGYVTTAGNEHSAGQSFCLESFEHTSSGGKASLVLHARDGWGVLGDWKARHQFRWNRTSDDFNVKEIMAMIMARAGLKLEVISQSPVITGFYPDFTVSPDNDGRAVIRKLLSFVPDVLFIEGNTAYIVNPLSSDSSVYSYGGEHQVREGRYLRGALQMNRVQVEGYDTAGGNLILADSFDWDEIDRLYDRLVQVEDRDIGTVAEAQQRGQAYLRQAEIEAAGGAIVIPVNCGQQLYDVVDVTDVRAGLDAEKKRVLGLVLFYNPQRGEYRQRLNLGAV